MSLIDPSLEGRAARRAGYSDRFHGYRADPGDWGPAERVAYQAAFQAGRADARAGVWKAPT